MKKIINGRIFDTEKGVPIGYSDNLGSGADSVSDFGYWEAELYKTPRSGRFFLAGAGGPMTRWARPSGRTGQTGSSGIIPLDYEEALEWASKYLDPDTVMKHFEIEEA